MENHAQCRAASCICHYPKKELFVIGLAGNYEEALEVAGHIISEVYGKTEGFDVKSYLQHKESRSL